MTNDEAVNLFSVFCLLLIQHEYFIYRYLGVRLVTLANREVNTLTVPGGSDMFQLLMRSGAINHTCEAGQSRSIRHNSNDHIALDKIHESSMINSIRYL